MSLLAVAKRLKRSASHGFYGLVSWSYCLNGPLGEELLKGIRYTFSIANNLFAQSRAKVAAKALISIQCGMASNVSVMRNQFSHNSADLMLKTTGYCRSTVRQNQFVANHPVNVKDNATSMLLHLDIFSVDIAENNFTHSPNYSYRIFRFLLFVSAFRCLLSIFERIHLWIRIWIGNSYLHYWR